MSGGSPSSPPPQGVNGGPPLLVADAASIKDMTTSAREALTKLNDILSENAAPVKDAIANIDTFSAALARNSDKVDTIIAGLEKFVGGGNKPETVSYELTAPSRFPDIPAIPTSQLSVSAPTTVVALDSQRITIKNADGLVPAFENFRWADSIPLLVQSRLIQGYENADYTLVGTDASGIASDYQLLINIRRFELDTTTATPTAEVAMMAKIMDLGGQVVDAKLFAASAPVAATDKPEVIAAGLNSAFDKAATDLIVWSLDAISSDEGSGGGKSPAKAPAKPPFKAPPTAPAMKPAKTPGPAPAPSAQ